MKTRIIYGLLAGLFMGMYWLTWTGAVLFVAILAVYLFVYLISARLHHRYNVYLNIVGIVVVGGITAVLFTEKIIPRVFSGSTAVTTIELVSLNLFTALGSFSVLTLLIPVILAFLVYKAIKQGDASTILLLVWSVVILVIMLEYRRFAYYFAVNVALLTGWFIWYTWRRLRKQDILKAVMAMVFLCAVAIIPTVQQATAKHYYFTPSDAWCETLTWVKENTREDSIILSWWDYGYWIERIAGRDAYITPSQEVDKTIDTACLFLSPSPYQREVGNSIYHDYLILDYTITTSKFKAVTIWAGKTVEIYSPEYYQSLIVRLYNSEIVGLYQLVYQSEQEIGGVPEIMVFYKRKVIDGQ